MNNWARPPERALIMHFTHITNMPAILASGRLIADSSVAALLVTNVGATDIKAARRQRRVSCPPFGMVADYVPFYFAQRSPMMYRIACEHRDQAADRYPGGDDPLVYLVSSVDRVHDAGLAWAASDGNCAASLTRFTRSLHDLAELVDWPLMGEEIWKNLPDDRDRVRRRMAEFLVHREFPLDLVTGYVVRTPSRKEELRQVLRSAGAPRAYVDVRPSWYYGYAPGEVSK
ncbi:toxin-antitoxin system toxin DarT [Micromonospora polyrhachis]|uniref:DarT domain-containing protein n=1 Tax=Micromonospora polyrhachis TaxID=1282883 RepID=A0A7W7WNP9_9ACTN|nr:DUF4433 domain-containing protein [Micromonospora polyrhachis]MBB4957857.1 hypothetical protein [Micromonospora polyrhachis]